MDIATDSDQKRQNEQLWDFKEFLSYNKWTEKWLETVNFWPGMDTQVARKPKKWIWDQFNTHVFKTLTQTLTFKSKKSDQTYSDTSMKRRENQSIINSQISHKIGRLWEYIHVIKRLNLFKSSNAWNPMKNLTLQLCTRSVIYFT